MATSTVSPLMRGPVPSLGPAIWHPARSRAKKGLKGQSQRVAQASESGKHLLGSSVDDVNAPPRPFFWPVDRSTG
jgi:hypothetical protein